MFHLSAPNYAVLASVGFLVNVLLPIHLCLLDFITSRFLVKTKIYF